MVLVTDDKMVAVSKTTFSILIKISRKFVAKSQINYIPSMVQIMVWRRPGDKPLSEPMMSSLPAHLCITLPQGVNDPSLKEWIKIDLLLYFVKKNVYWKQVWKSLKNLALLLWITLGITGTNMGITFWKHYKYCLVHAVVIKHQAFNIQFTFNNRLLY